MILTIAEIVDLAEFAGISMHKELLPPLEDEITIADCPATGILDDDGGALHYKRIAYFTDIPEEGAYGLGPEVSAPAAQGESNAADI